MLKEHNKWYEYHRGECGRFISFFVSYIGCENPDDREAEACRCATNGNNSVLRRNDGAMPEFGDMRRLSFRVIWLFVKEVNSEYYARLIGTYIHEALRYYPLRVCLFRAVGAGSWQPTR